MGLAGTSQQTYGNTGFSHEDAAASTYAVRGGRVKKCGGYQEYLSAADVGELEVI